MRTENQKTTMPKNETLAPDFSYEVDYNAIMKNASGSYVLPSLINQWTSKEDFFVKFSLYPESSTGETASNTTCLTLSTTVNA